MCLGVGSRCFGAEPLLSSWDGRERHGTGLWTGTHTTDKEKNPQQIYKDEMDVRTILSLKV